MNIAYFLLGSVRISADHGSAAELLNLCMLYSIPYADFKIEAERISLCMRLFAFRRFKREAVLRQIEYRVDAESGIPVILSRYKYRFGIFLGVILSAVMIIMAQSFVWNIEVTGNERLTTREVKEILDEHGFGIGSYIKGVDTDIIENQILIDSDEISWIAINISGTTASIELREREKTKAESTSAKPANLIAAKSGVVEEVRIYRGNCVVEAGRFVKKGELLVSGLYDSVQTGFRYTRASGEVFARTVEEFYIEIPFEYEAKSYTGEQYCDKYLNFFDYSINIYKNSGKKDDFYDKISIVEDCVLPGGVKTPFSITSESYLAYETVTVYRTPNEAEELAYFELESRLAEISESSILIQKTITPYLRNDRFMLHCVLVIIEDIAVVSEFDVVLGE